MCKASGVMFWVQRCVRISSCVTEFIVLSDGNMKKQIISLIEVQW